MKFKIFKSPINGRWYFRIVGKNGRTVAQSEGYTRKRNAEKTVEAIKSDLR